VGAYLVDSDVLMDALGRRRQRLELLNSLALRADTLGWCAVNVSEVYSGLLPEEENRGRRLLNSLEFHAVTLAIARQAGFLRWDWARKGVSLSVADVTIAAVAMSYRLTLITGNTKDFPMPELSLYRWD